MQSKEHWEKVYSSKKADEVSWFQRHAELSLKIIRDNHVPADGAIIDVGGGASILVDDLIENGYSEITVLDLSATALEKAKARLGAKASSVRWLEANVLDVDLPANGYDVWHDRAVFHFLTSHTERHRYVQQVLRAVKPGGLVIVATFAEDGPDKCSGLPVMRYSTSALHSEFGKPFELLGSEPELHRTPAGNEQKFVYCFCKRG
ncbi:MAG: class I SAM-dependent methyltransferase [Pseudohongiellaceae bacterium]